MSCQDGSGHPLQQCPIIPTALPILGTDGLDSATKAVRLTMTALMSKGDLFDVYGVYHPYLEVLTGPALPWLLVGSVSVYIVFFLVTWIFAPTQDLESGRNGTEIHD